MGLYYFRARFYSTVRARFLNEDPIGLAGGDENLYRYVRNDPISHTDPLGLDTRGGTWIPDIIETGEVRRAFDTHDLKYRVLNPGDAIYDPVMGGPRISWDPNGNPPVGTRSRCGASSWLTTLPSANDYCAEANAAVLFNRLGGTSELALAVETARRSPPRQWPHCVVMFISFLVGWPDPTVLPLGRVRYPLNANTRL